MSIVPDTPFRKLVRKLKSPTSISFNLLRLKEAFAAAATRDPSDVALYRTAVWISEESAAWRSRAQPMVERLATLGGQLSTVLAVAALNREYMVAQTLARESMKLARDKGALAIDHIVAQPLQTGYPGQKMSADSIIEASVDAAESWIYDALNMPIESASIPQEISDIVISNTERYSLQKGLNNLWNDALFGGWFLDVDKENFRYVTPHRDFLAKREAWLARQQSNFMSYAWLDIFGWTQYTPKQRRSQAKRTVVGVSSGPRRRIKVATPNCLSKCMPQILVEQSGLSRSYLDWFIDSPLPDAPTLTCNIINRAWHVINDLGQILISNVPEPSTLTVRQAYDLALVVSLAELRRCLSRALEVRYSVADELIDFLTFKPKLIVGQKGHRGIWASPIIKIPGTETFALALSALAASNPLRKCEAWLEKGGLTDIAKSARGEIFEASYRESICKALAENSVLDDARCGEHAINKTADFDEQIDLIVQIGSLLFVGELKFHLTPTEPQETYRHFQKLEAASIQANRKVNLLKTRPDVTAVALGISLDKAKTLKVIPLIIDNQGFGLGLEVDGCRVTESRYFQTCLGSPVLSVQAAFSPETKSYSSESITLYRSQSDAERKFERLLANPPTLDRFLKRITWSDLRYPTSSGKSLIREIPTLGDYQGEEYEMAQRMANNIRRGKQT